jgi:hypothetical protein
VPKPERVHTRHQVKLVGRVECIGTAKAIHLASPPRARAQLEGVRSARPCDVRLRAQPAAAAELVGTRPACEGSLERARVWRDERNLEGPCRLEEDLVGRRHDAHSRVARGRERPESNHVGPWRRRLTGRGRRRRRRRRGQARRRGWRRRTQGGTLGLATETLFVLAVGIKGVFLAFEVALPHGQQVALASAVWVDFRHAALKWKMFLVESGGGAVDVTEAGGQEHRHPLRRASVGVVDLRQLARHTGLRHVRGESGAEDGSDADEDERSDARRVLLRLWVEKTEEAWSLSARRSSSESTAKPRIRSIPSLGRSQGPRGGSWGSGGAA